MNGNQLIIIHRSGLMRYLLIMLQCLSLHLQAQDTTSQLRPTATSGDTTSTDQLLADLVDSSAAQPLLPRHPLLTQRVFWGPKGLMRIAGVAPLTPKGRANELRIRRTMLVGHQVMGLVTLAGFVAQGIVGAKLYNAQGESYTRLLSTHRQIATGLNISYGATALLSLTAPPKLVEDRKGLSGIKLHKYLALVHLTGMVAINVLAGMLDAHPELKPYHRAAAYTTFGAFAISVFAIKL